jgi:NAD(P)H-quinone oxidoreductase subunit 5
MENAVVVLAIILAPWIAASISALGSRSRLSRDRIGRLAAAVVAGGFVVAVGLAAVVVGSAPPSLGFGATTLRVDALALILSIVVLGLSALIQSFAIRYLRGDTRQLWFVTTCNLLTGATVLMVCAGSVAVFAVAWIGAGGALILLLATYRTLDQARIGVRRTALRFLIADSAFVVGVTVLLVFAGGDVALDELGAVATSMPLPVQLGVALSLVAAALARSSQLPFQGWLPFTLAAPTPVSALMHAGVVNAGAILVIRFAPAIAPHQLVMIVIFAAGAATMLYASTVRLTRPDVKGRLVFSTMAQMGFMIMTCGLGLFAAAIFHLVAHSLFKSALFLGAGMGVRHHAVDRDLPTRRLPSRSQTVAGVALAVIVPAASLAGAKVLFAPDSTAASLGLLAFVAVTASVALGSAFRTNFTPRTIATGTAATVAVAVGYVVFLGAFSAALQPSSIESAAPAWLLVLPAVGLLLLQLLSSNPRAFGSLRDVIYARSVASAIHAPSTVKGTRT